MIGDPLRAANLLQRLHEPGACHTALLNDFAGIGFGFRQRQQIMFGAEEFVLHSRHLFFSAVNRLAQFAAKERLDSGALDLGALVEQVLKPLFESARGNAEFVEQRACDSLTLVEETGQGVRVGDLLVLAAAGQILGGLERFLHLLGESIGSHISPSFSSRKLTARFSEESLPLAESGWRIRVSGWGSLPHRFCGSEG